MIWKKKFYKFNKVISGLSVSKFIDKDIKNLFTGYPEKLIWNYINQFKQ